MNDFICANCMHGKKYRADCEWEYMYDGTDYANDCCDWWRPTNADRIRAMTDEELAEWYWWMLHYVKGYTDSRAALREWLKQDYTTFVAQEYEKDLNDRLNREGISP